MAFKLDEEMISELVRQFESGIVGMKEKPTSEESSSSKLVEATKSADKTLKKVAKKRKILANKAEKAKKAKQSKYLVKQSNKKEKLKKCKTSKDKEKQKK